MELIKVEPKILMSKYLITNKEYEEFDPKHQRCKHSNLDDQPVVNVSWFNAIKYCEWLTKLTNKKYRLPFSIEWKFIASGGGKRKYPWGDDKPTKNHANFDDNVGHTTIVGSYPKGATPEGLFDMAGNVWEWCADLYNENQQIRVLRGGSWFNNDESLRCSARGNIRPDYWSNGIGFRVACS